MKKKQDDWALQAMLAEMRVWRSRPVPEVAPGKPMSDQMKKLLGCDTPEGLASFERGRAYREAGYAGPLNAYGCIPNPDDPAELDALSGLTALGQTGKGRS
jgi:hypothetical protein